MSFRLEVAKMIFGRPFEPPSSCSQCMAIVLFSRLILQGLRRDLRSVCRHSDVGCLNQSYGFFFAPG